LEGANCRRGQTRAKDGKIAGIAEYEVEVLGADLIEGAGSCGIVHATVYGEHVGNPHFHEHLKVLTDRLTQYAEE